MKVMVTGAAGMLGSELCPELKRRGHAVFATDINELVLKHKESAVLNILDLEKMTGLVKKNRVDAIFHLAAETNVDLCEKDHDHAYLYNTVGTENVALTCLKNDILMVYISTGAVFSGEKKGFYTEFDEPGPVNVYGRTKLEGEKIIRRMLEKYFIFRAGWMMGGREIDKKFVYKIIKLIEAGKMLKVVSDKFGSLTYTRDFAANIPPVVETGRYGLYHMANKGSCSRFDIAKTILKYMQKEDSVKLVAVDSSEFPLPAPRAKSEALRNYKLELLGNNSMPEWEDALERYLKDFFSKD